MMTKDETIDMLYARIENIRGALNAATDLLSIIHGNARVIPDIYMQGATDCYAVPLDDVDAIPKVMLKAIAVKPAGRA
jgi:hypothetical protein